jgi:hypothetical protein
MIWAIVARKITLISVKVQPVMMHYLFVAHHQRLSTASLSDPTIRKQDYANFPVPENRQLPIVLFPHLNHLVRRDAPHPHAISLPFRALQQLPRPSQMLPRRGRQTIHQDPKLAATCVGNCLTTLSISAAI